MNHSKKNNFPITNIGSVTLMMIFIVLCMVSFAVLSLSTAASDSRAAEKSAKHVKEYYTASNKAEETLASIADTLGAAYQASDSEDKYFEQVRAVYNTAGTTTLADSDDGLVISYSVNMNKKQALAVSVLVQYPTHNTSMSSSASSSESESGDAFAGSSSENSFYKITSWQVVSTTEWKGDNSVKLIGE